MTADLVHGTNLAYEKRGCRCEDCRAFQRARVARNRAQRLASGNLNHGTRSAYDAGCRCHACRMRRHAATVREIAARRSRS